MRRGNGCVATLGKVSTFLNSFAVSLYYWDVSLTFQSAIYEAIDSLRLENRSLHLPGG